MVNSLVCERKKKEVNLNSIQTVEWEEQNKQKPFLTRIYIHFNKLSLGQNCYLCYLLNVYSQNHNLIAYL